MPVYKKLDETIELSMLPKTPPNTLNEDEKRTYLELYPLLTELKCVAADLPIIVVLCQAIVMNREAKSQVDAQGQVIVGAKGSVKNPYFQTWRETAELIKKYSADIACSPGSRARLGLTIEMKDPTDDLESLLESV